jgi:hypothetical protein
VFSLGEFGVVLEVIEKVSPLYRVMWDNGDCGIYFGDELEMIENEE